MPMEQTVRRLEEITFPLSRPYIAYRDGGLGALGRIM
jgi:hypothetical protein